MNAVALLRPTCMPTAVAASWSMATACIAAPRLVRDRKRTSRTVAVAAIASTTRSYVRIRTPKTSSGAPGTGEGTARPVAPQIMMISASRTMPKPMVPISMRSKSLFSSGRSTRSITRPMAPVSRIATAIASTNGSFVDR
nr:hypothetical protein GCM10020092_062330 [Actinoplanes digitatis]